MKLKIENILITVVPALIVIAMFTGLIYLLIDNTRLEFVNSVIEYRIQQKEEKIDAAQKELIDVKSDLVEWQNTANGYKWQLEQINDEYFGEDK